MQAVKEALGQAIGDASASIYGHSCAKANAKMNQLSTSLKDQVDKAYSLYLEKCAKAHKGNSGKFSLKDMVHDAIALNKPMGKAVAGALQDGKSCGCNQSACTYCNSSSGKTKPLESTSDISFTTLKPAAAPGGR